MYTPSLLEQTYALLDASEESVSEIAEGAGVNPHWLAKFRRRRWENPGVVSVERVYRYLSTRAARGAA